jgi:hypothetical protein
MIRERMKQACFIACFGMLVWAGFFEPSVGEPLRLLQVISIPAIKGRIDHLAIDFDGQRIFVAALGNNTVEIISLSADAWIRSLKGFQEPQGLACIPELNRLAVASGGDGTCKIFEANTFNLVNSLHFSGDADNVRYDSKARTLYVGYGEGGIAVVDPAHGKLIGDVKLGGHPESFQLEKTGSRIFVNLPAGPHVAVIDRSSKTLSSKWSLDGVRQNFPMALDEVDSRLFVGCRQPACVLVFDTYSGKIVADVPIAGDTDDLFYESENRRIYASCGEGFINILEQQDTDHYKAAGKIPTARGARTSLLVPALKRFYLAVPRREDQGAEIRVYEVRGRQTGTRKESS